MIPKPTLGDRLLSTAECCERLHVSRAEWRLEVAASVTLQAAQERRPHGFYYREAGFAYYLAYERSRERRSA